jgi:hypothetical protein
MNALQQAGATTHVLPYTNYPSECGWSIVDAANTLVGRRDHYSIPKFWDSLDRAFWATLPPTPYLLSLVDILGTAVGKRNVILATSPTICPECVAGKLEWIQRFLPPWLHRSYAITPRKELMARPGVLLIDDRVENCEKFMDRGGKSLVVAQPWNRRGFKNSDTFLSLQSGLVDHLGVTL